MEVFNRQEKINSGGGRSRRALRLLSVAVYYVAVTLCLLSIFQSSLLVSSQPLRADESAAVDRAVGLLEEKGFAREAFLLRRLTMYRNTDNWLNQSVEKDTAFAATNYPFNVVTLYPDFFHKTTDDTERAMVLLHEAQHLQGANEQEAYAYVWRHRRALGWTLVTHGTTESYVTVEEQTREIAPELFSCADRLWNDCTENPKPATVAQAK